MVKSRAAKFLEEMDQGNLGMDGATAASTDPMGGATDNPNADANVDIQTLIENLNDPEAVAMAVECMEGQIDKMLATPTEGSELDMDGDGDADGVDTDDDGDLDIVYHPEDEEDKIALEDAKFALAEAKAALRRAKRR